MARSRDFLAIVSRFFNIQKGRARPETIHKQVMEGLQVDGIHVCSLIAAMIIASIALNINSTEATIGAMLICPIMGSVVGLAYAVATADRTLLRNALAVIASQVIVCLMTSTVYFLISPLSQITGILTSNSTATIWDVVIALVGGFAGALGSSRRQPPSTLIAGVAVATSLMPPLCAAGYGLANSNLMFVLAALYEFFLNVVFIAFGAELVFLALEVPMSYEDKNGDGVIDDNDKALSKRAAQSLRRKLIVGSFIFLIPCVFISMGVVKRAMDDTGTIQEIQDTYDTARTTKELKAVCPSVTDYRIGLADSYDMEKDMFMQHLVAVIETDARLDHKTEEELEQLVRVSVPNVIEVTFEENEPPFVGPMPQIPWGDKTDETDKAQPDTGTSGDQPDGSQPESATPAE